MDGIGERREFAVHPMPFTALRFVYPLVSQIWLALDRFQGLRSTFQSPHLRSQGVLISHAEDPIPGELQAVLD